MCNEIIKCSNKTCILGRKINFWCMGITKKIENSSGIGYTFHTVFESYSQMACNNMVTLAALRTLLLCRNLLLQVVVFDAYIHFVYWSSSSHGYSLECWEGELVPRMELLEALEYFILCEEQASLADLFPSISIVSCLLGITLDWLTRKSSITAIHSIWGDTCYLAFSCQVYISGIYSVFLWSIDRHFLRPIQ